VSLREFLFAVVRDVQANIPDAVKIAVQVYGFYSLSCETYRRTR